MGVEKQNENTWSAQKIQETFKDTLAKVPETNKDAVAKLLEEMTKEKGQITKETRNDWKNLSYDVRKSIQESVWAKVDWKIGQGTLNAIQSKIKGEPVVVESKVEPKVVVETKVEKVKPTEAPKVEVVTPTEAPKETISSKYINDSISKVENILKNWIQSGEEKKLTNLIKELQDKKILKSIPGIKWGELEEGQDLISIWEDVIDRLEKVSDLLTDSEDKTKENDEKSAKEKSRKEKEDSDKKTEQEKKDISNLETWLSKLDITDIVKRINDSIEAKNHLDKSSILEEQVWFEAKQNDLKSKLDKVKLSSDNKTLADLTWTTSVEKDEKWNLTLKFNLDPKGLFDKFDSSKTYNVKLNSTNLESQKTAILGEVEKAYIEQVSNLTK